MTHPSVDSARAKLELNARGYKPDADLDRVADLIEAGDRDALAKLPPKFVDHAQIHGDFRAHYRRAVAAGAIPADRTPDTHQEN